MNSKMRKIMEISNRVKMLKLDKKKKKIGNSTNKSSKISKKT